MSSRCKKKVEYVPVMIPQGRRNCICSFTDLIKLILIILQFSCPNKDRDKNDIIGNDILFIIALYFLSCASCNESSYQMVYICPKCGGYCY